MNKAVKLPACLDSHMGEEKVNYRAAKSEELTDVKLVPWKPLSRVLRVALLGRQKAHLSAAEKVARKVEPLVAG